MITQGSTTTTLQLLPPEFFAITITLQLQLHYNYKCVIITITITDYNNTAMYVCMYVYIYVCMYGCYTFICMTVCKYCEDTMVQSNSLFYSIFFISFQGQYRY